MKSMRTLFLLSVNLLFTTVMILHAQDKMPQAVSYQAVARDAQGKVVAQKAIGIQVEILKGSTTGAVVFSETHFPTSSQTGTVNLLIGQGTRKIGTFSSVSLFLRPIILSPITSGNSCLKPKVFSITVI